jgi:hypothetical protein
MIASDKRRAGVDAGSGFHESAIETQAKRGHGFGLVDIGRRKQFHPDGAKNVLRGGEDGLIVLAASGDIEQAEEYTLGTDAQGIVEISGHAAAQRAGSQLSAGDLGEASRDGLGSRKRLGRA